MTRFSKRCLQKILINDTCVDNPIEVFANRQTGRSTAIALRCIADAIDNPNVFIDVRDHIGTVQANRYLLDNVMKLIAKTELEHFEAKRTACQIRFTGVVEMNDVQMMFLKMFEQCGFGSKIDMKLL